MENKVTISELPELFYAEGAESIPVDSYDPTHKKNRTFQVKIDVIRDYIESNLYLAGAVTISAEPDNRLELKQDGLYVSNTFDPDPLPFYILSKG